MGIIGSVQAMYSYRHYAFNSSGTNKLSNDSRYIRHGRH